VAGAEQDVYVLPIIHMRWDKTDAGRLLGDINSGKLTLYAYVIGYKTVTQTETRGVTKRYILIQNLSAVIWTLRANGAYVAISPTGTSTPTLLSLYHLSSPSTAPATLRH